jgi:serine/threonine protein kinase
MDRWVDRLSVICYNSFPKSYSHFIFPHSGMNHSSSFNAPTLEIMNRLLPGFEFIALISSDGLSAVYVAKQRSLDRDVAIKILSPHVSGNSEFRQSFEVTARTMARLNHPNLIGVFNSGLVDQMLYFVMEFIPGKSLEHSARGHCVELSQALQLIEGICNGLAHAHDHGIVHGAVKPSIILLNQKAEPKIGNFGFSHTPNAEGGGENPYLAPEILSGSVEPDPRSDIYAVGAILYQLLTGHPHRHGAPAPSKVITCGPNIDEIWRKATHPEPSLRFACMRDFEKDITALTKPVHGGVGQSSPSSQAVAGPVAPRMPSTAALPPAGRSLPPPARRSGIPWQLILNLILLFVLGYSIKYASEKYKSRNVRVIEIRRPADGDSSQGRELGTDQDPHDARILPKPEIPAHETETPEDSLARLRGDLVSGQRNEMPVGSVRNGESDYFLVKEEMSWPEASEFAEKHGAHLAIPSAGADLTWLVGNVTRKQAVWIGAARSGSRTWALADGKPWRPIKEPSGTGFYVGIDKDGLLRAASAKVRLPFVIQWHRDGRNPGSLDALFDLTRESLGKSEPLYPPGTLTFENRSFLFVNRPVDWKSAVNLAEKSGGHLAVIATVGEIAVVEEMTNDFIANNGIWLGASLKGQQWTWITGESWKTAKWGVDAATETADTALIILPGKSWSSLDISESASGFLIEWSADGKSKPIASGETPGVTTASGVTDMEALSRKAKELITAADLKRTEQLGLNSRKFASDLDSHLRSLPGGSREIWRPEVEKLKNSITNSRIPSMIPQSSGIKINTVMDEIAKWNSKKQDQIDEDFLTYSGKIHAAFLAKVRESAAQARQAGQNLLAKSLDDTLAEADELESWTRSLGIEAKPENPVPRADGR